MTDRLPGLSARLDTLGDQPVQAHPDVLEAVHRELVRELDELAGGGPTPGVGGSGGSGS